MIERPQLIASLPDFGAMMLDRGLWHPPNVHVTLHHPDGRTTEHWGHNRITDDGVSRMRNAWLGESGNAIGAGMEIHNGAPSSSNLIGTTGAPSVAQAIQGSNLTQWTMTRIIPADSPITVANVWNFCLPTSARTIMMEVQTGTISGLPNPIVPGTRLVVVWSLSCGPSLSSELVPGGTGTSASGAVRILRSTADFVNRITGNSQNGSTNGTIKFWSSNPIDFDPLNPMIPVLRDPSRAIYQSSYDVQTTFIKSGTRGIAVVARGGTSTSDTWTYPIVTQVPRGYGTSWAIMESDPNFLCWMQQDPTQPRDATAEITWGFNFFGG